MVGLSHNHKRQCFHRDQNYQRVTMAISCWARIDMDGTDRQYTGGSRAREGTDFQYSSHCGVSFCMKFRAIVMPWCSRSIRFTDGQGLIIVLKPCNAIPGRSRSRSSLSVLLQYHDPLLLVLTTLTMLSARLFGYYEIEHRVEILLMRCMSFPAPGSINVLVDLAMARFVVFDIWIQYLARND